MPIYPSNRPLQDAVDQNGHAAVYPRATRAYRQTKWLLWPAVLVTVHALVTGWAYPYVHVPVAFVLVMILCYLGGTLADDVNQFARDQRRKAEKPGTP